MIVILRGTEALGLRRYILVRWRSDGGDDGGGDDEEDKKKSKNRWQNV